MKQIFLFLFFALCAIAQPLPSVAVESIENEITAFMAKNGVPGLSMTIATGDRIRWSGGYGMADVENYVPAKASTVYRLASISKPITATAIMQLVERGKIDLDAPVTRYVASWPEKPPVPTVRQLLGHQGGIRHYRNDDFAMLKHYTSIRESLENFRNDPLAYEPGTKYQYTTYGYVLLGAVIEGASGQRYLDFVRDNVFRPAAMDTIREDNLYTIIPNRAAGYMRTREGELMNSGITDLSYKLPGGGFCSTTGDLVKFALAMQNGTLVRAATLDRMWTRGVLRDGKRTGYGLGWQVVETDTKLVAAAHGGNQQRVSTYLAIFPQIKATVAVMTNLEAVPGLYDLALRVGEIAGGN